MPEDERNPNWKIFPKSAEEWNAQVRAAAANAGRQDPLLSPNYGDMRGFPHAILPAGTRDLLLSNTVRVHRKLRQAGVEAVLQVYEGQAPPNIPRRRRARVQGGIRGDRPFLRLHLGK